MGSDEFRKRRKTRQKERKIETREPKPNSFLIVCEGKCTEPNYFSGLADYINSKYGESINVQKPEINPIGEGKCTVSLVNEAAKIVARSRIMYSQRWIVFDKDEFDDFDDAINLCNKWEFNAGWSNQSFEYWLYLHFYYSDSALHRNEWFDKLNQIFKSELKIENGYNKNDLKLFEHVTVNGGLRRAINNAERVDMSYPDGMPPSRRDPCTRVYKLLRELEPWIEELL